MLNDENDKWSDDGDLPLNSTYNNIDNLEMIKKEKKKSLDNKNISLDNDSNIMNDSNISLNNDSNIMNDSNKNQLSSPKEELKDIQELKKQISSPKEELKDIQELKKQISKLKDETKNLSYIKEFGNYIRTLGSTVNKLSDNLKTFTDAKSWEAINRGKLNHRRYANYFDVHNTITTAASSDPNDFDSTVYNVERVFEYLERYAEIIYVTNDGTDNLYVIVSHGGRTRFSAEAIIYPGEIKCYFNVYELRLRSPTAELPYRVSEYCIENISEISNIPIEKASIHNSALPAIGADWLATDISPTNTPTTLMIEVAVSIVGNFSAVITNGGNSQTVLFNAVAGPALVAGSVYIFNLLVHSGDTVNFIYSATGGTIQILRVQELDSASA